MYVLITNEFLIMYMLREKSTHNKKYAVHLLFNNEKDSKI